MTATLSTEQIAIARSWVGDSVSDSALNDRYSRWYNDLSDETKSLYQTIIEELRHQLAVMTSDQPSSLSLAGGDSFSFSENIRTLRETLKDFINTGLGVRSSGGFRVSQLQRRDCR